MHSQQVTVKQAQRYKPEMALSCEEMFALLKTHREPELLRLLYYYCISTGQAVTKDIEDYLKEHRISINPAKKVRYVTMKKSVKLAKRVYHAIRRIRYAR